MSKEYKGGPQTRTIADLERQLAEAQGKLETMRAHHALHCGCGKTVDRILIDALQTALEGAEALAKRRGEALANMIQAELLRQPRKVRLRLANEGTAAIDATPAREKVKA